MRSRFKQILCVLTSTTGQEALISKACQLAKQHKAKLALQLALPALPPNAKLVMSSFAYIESQETLICDAERWLSDYVKSLDTDQPIDCEVSVGEVSQDVLATVASLQIDLVVAQAKAGLSGRLFGADSLHLLRHCPCPVWLLPHQLLPHHNVVMAAVDLNFNYGHEDNVIRQELNHAIVQEAAELAALANGTLHLVHVYEAIPEQYLNEGLLSMNEEELQAMTASIREERALAMASLVSSLEQSLFSQVNTHLSIQTHLVYGQSSHGLATTALQLDADVVVMGTITQVGIPGWLIGSTTEELAGELNCSILALKPAQVSTDVQ